MRSSPVWGLLLVIACSSNEDDGAFDFELGLESCDISSSLQLRSSNGATLAYSGCRFRFAAESKVLTWQLSTPGTSGTWLSPGAGWLNLSLNGASAEYASLAISSVISELPADVGDDEMVVTVAGPGGRVGARGSVAVGRNIVHLDGSGADLDATFNGVALTDGGVLFGNVALSAAASSTSPSNGGSGGDCALRCPSTCGSGTAPVQACLYCQAACLCACAGDSSCAAGNRASAAQLGTACGG